MSAFFPETPTKRGGSETPTVEPKTTRGDMHGSLRGKGLEEQQQMLAPTKARRPMGSLIARRAQQFEAFEAKNRRKPPAPLSKPKVKPLAPPTPEVEASPEIEVEPTSERDADEREAEVVEPTVPQGNKDVAERLETGAKGIAFIKGAVDKAGVAFKKSEDEQAAAAEAANKKRGFFKKMLGMGKKTFKRNTRVNFSKAVTLLEYRRGCLAGDAAKAKTAMTPVPTALLGASSTSTANTAADIEPIVNGSHPQHVRDISVAIGQGNQAMLEAVFKRGDVKYEDLKGMKKLGRGGSSATVYKTSYLDVAPMAYKVSDGATIGKGDEDAYKADDDMVAKEGSAMGGFDSPNILKSGGRTDRGNVAGYVMPMAKHGDMDALRTKKMAGMTPAERVPIIQHLVRGGFVGLAQLHEAGLVHSDVKNENFLLGDDLESKLMDFGLTETEAEDPKKRTKNVGTNVHMAPEVVLEGAGCKSDVWSMGETVLMALFDQNSVDIAKDRKDDGHVNDEFYRAKRFKDDKWLDKVAAKVTGLPDADLMMDFLRKVMTYDPKKRVSAKAALKHEFLAERKAAKGKKDLGELLGQ